MGLIAGEIDIELPIITFDEVNDFVKKTKEQYENSKLSETEKVYFARNNRHYPWDRRILEFEGRTFYDYKNQSPFNKIASIIDSFPIVPSSRVVALISQEEQPEYDFTYHFDNDKTYGFRLCYGLDTSTVFLEFAKLKEEFIQHALDLKKIEDTMVNEKIYTITPMKSNTVFCINGNRFPHKVPVNKHSKRFVLIVRGIVESVDNIQFINKVEE